MMKIDFPIITAPLPFSEYAEPMQGGVLVWVNIPEEKMIEHGKIILEISDLRTKLTGKAPEQKELSEDELKATLEKLQALAERRIKWLSEIWSQGPAETQISPEDIATIITHAQKTDPLFFEWLVNSSLVLIQEHRHGKKKRLS
jgi:hypothetical protein